MSVPCPLYVSLNEPYNVILTFSGCSPKIYLVNRPIRTAPAVCELDGPTITGPIISNTLLYFIFTPPIL